MNSLPNVPLEFRLEDPGGVRGCEGTNTYRLTCIRDGQSVLLHEINPSMVHYAVFVAQVPDFSEPFVTNFLGTTELSGRTFLVEPLPPSVSLLDAWRAVLHNNPSQAGNMLREIIAQLERLLWQQDHQCERHDAICAANVVLTDQRTYGLLAARLETTRGDIWLRRLEWAAPATRQDANSLMPTDTPETIAQVVEDLLAIETDLQAVSVQDRSELHRLYVADIEAATEQ